VSSYVLLNKLINCCFIKLRLLKLLRNRSRRFLFF